MQFKAPLVGMRFRPPAADVVNMLAGGTALTLVREPDNPHDFNAIKVMLYGCCEGGVFEPLFKQLLAETPEGSTNRENLMAEPMFLGYVKATEAVNIAPVMDRQLEQDPGSTPHLPAELAFDIEGRPCVQSQGYNETGENQQNVA